MLEWLQPITNQTAQAIEAAAVAFPKWRATSPLVRFEALDRIGSEILARVDELGDMLAREEGKTLSEANAEAHRAGHLFKYFAAETYRTTGDVYQSLREGVSLKGSARANRRRGRDHALEFPAGDPGMENRARPGLWQYGCVQTCRTGARVGLDAVRHHCPRGPSRGRVQSGDGHGRRSRGSDRCTPQGLRGYLSPAPHLSGARLVPRYSPVGPKCSLRWGARTH